jgi:hypothetical protein
MTILERKAGRNLPKQKTLLHLHRVTLDKCAGLNVVLIKEFISTAPSSWSAGIPQLVSDIGKYQRLLLYRSHS